MNWRSTLALPLKEGYVDTVDKFEKGKGYKVNSLEDLKAIAEAVGCTLYKGADDELLCDFDEINFGDFVDLSGVGARSIIGERFQLQLHDGWRSRNGKTHVVYKMDRVLPPLARIALQAALGSDPRREALAVYEFLSAGTDTISLFKPKEAK